MNKSTKVQKLSQSANDQIFALATLADKGADGAAAELYSTVAGAVGLLKFLCKKKPQMFTPIAREEFSWPIMHSLHPEMVREDAAFLREITLGKNTQINFSSGKTFSW